MIDECILDYICDVHMDISHQFFPLPSVVVPNIIIKRPFVTEVNQRLVNLSVNSIMNCAWY